MNNLQLEHLNKEEYKFISETNYLILDNKVAKIALRYSNINNTSFIYGKNINTLEIKINQLDSISNTLNLYLYNPNNIIISIEANKFSTDFELNLLLISRKNSNIIINTNNKNTKTKLVVNALALGFDKANIKIECIGTILNKTNGAINKQILKGYNFGNANITLVPILKISEYDVKANHGAVIGSCNDDDVFYLMSRGLTQEMSLELIQYGIIKPWINQIKNEEFYKLVVNDLGYNE